MRWPDWPTNALLIFGPKGSGKSHLGHIWALRADAVVLDARQDFSPQSLREPALIEDIEHMQNQEHLLHTLNYSRENNRSLLLTSGVSVRELPFTLPDLTSRLLALPVGIIEAPDDEVIVAAMRKQFADRQMKVDDEILSFLLPRMERSFAHIAEVIAALDRQALAEQRNLTIPFIKKILGY